jgi:hypothetical protein
VQSVVDPVETRELTGVPAADATEPHARPRRRPRWPGILSLVFALLTVAGLVTGIVLATSDLFLEATWAAWAGIGASGLAVVLALVALIGRLGSGWAAAGLVLGVVANPFVLTTALDLIGGLWA